MCRYDTERSEGIKVTKNQLYIIYIEVRVGLSSYSYFLIYLNAR
nr:MAG TPA: hypothetical protein [Caudoviricetes sp.]